MKMYTQAEADALILIRQLITAAKEDCPQGCIPTIEVDELEQALTPDAARLALEEREKDIKMHMYVWSRKPRFIAVAQAESVEKAREAMLNSDELAGSGDGSCPERDKARDYIRSTNPTIWHRENAEFALTDSAELIEIEEQSDRLRKELTTLREREAKLIADTRLETAKRWHTQVALAAMGQDVKQECRDMIAELEAAVEKLRGGTHGS